MFRKNTSTIKYSDWSLKGFGLNSAGPASQMVAQHYICIGQCIVLPGVSGTGMESVTRIKRQQSENTVQSPNAVSMSRQIVGQH